MSIGKLEEKTKLAKVPLNKYGNTHGGVRPNSGRPKGGANKSTLERMQIKQRVVDRIHHNADTLLNAALIKAVGEQYLIRKVTERDSKDKVIRVYHETVTDPRTIIDYLDGELEGNDSISDDDNWYYLSTKPVDISAVKDLFDRAFGKPVEKIEEESEKRVIIETRRGVPSADNTPEAELVEAETEAVQAAATEAIQEAITDPPVKIVRSIQP